MKDSPIENDRDTDVRLCLCNILDMLGGDGVSAAIEETSVDDLRKEIVGVVLEDERLARAHERAECGKAITLALSMVDAGDDGGAYEVLREEQRRLTLADNGAD